MFSPSQFQQSRILFQAAADGQLDIMKSAIELKANPHYHSKPISQLYTIDIPGYCSINCVDETMYNILLHMAVLSDSTSILDYVIQDLGVNGFNIPDRMGLTSIAIAARNNKPIAVRYLIEQYGVDPKQTKKSRHNVLMTYYNTSLPSLAIYGGNEELATYLLDLDPETAGEVALTYLQLGKIEQFQLLIQTHGDILQAHFNKYPSISLITAIQSHSIEIVEYMANKIHDLKVSSEVQEMILLHAIASSSFDIIRYLITNLDFRIFSFKSQALHITNGEISIDIVDFVLNIGLTYNRLSEYLVQSFLIDFATHGQFTYMKHFIHKYDITTSETNLLHACLKSGQCTIEMIDYINGLGPHFQHNKRQLSLLIAFEHGYSLDIIKYLVQCGADMIECIGSDDFVKSFTKPSIINIDVVEYIFEFIPNTHYSNNVHFFISDIVECAVPQRHLNLLQYLDSKYTIRINETHLHSVLSLYHDSNDLLTFILSKLEPLAKFSKEVFDRIFQNHWVSDEIIIQIIEKLNFDANSYRYDGKTIFHVIALTTRSTQFFDIMMHYINDDGELLQICDDTGSNVLLSALPKWYKLFSNSTESIKPSLIQFYQHLVTKYHYCFDLDAIDSSTGYSLCHYAAQFDDPTLMSLLIQYKADFNKPSINNKNETPLYIAVQTKNVSITKLLLQHKAPINPLPTIDKKKSIIRRIYQHGDSFTDVQKYIITELNLPPPSLTFLMNDVLGFTHSQQHRYELCQLLLQKGANVGSMVNISALHKSVILQDKELVSLFINTKAPINHISQSHSSFNDINIFNKTSLTLAFELKSYDIVKLLISAKANVNVLIPIDMDLYQTPLHIVQESGLNDDIKNDLFLHLIQHNANINQTNTNQITPIMQALSRGDFDDVEYFITHCNNNIDTTITNGDGDILLHALTPRTPIELCISILHMGNVQLCNHTNNYNFTPLHQSVLFESFNISHILIDHGADMTLCDFHGNTILHHIITGAYIDEDDGDDDDDYHFGHDNINDDDRDGDVDGRFDVRNSVYDNVDMDSLNPYQVLESFITAFINYSIHNKPRSCQCDKV